MIIVRGLVVFVCVRIFCGLEWDGLGWGRGGGYVCVDLSEVGSLRRFWLGLGGEGGKSWG